MMINQQRMGIALINWHYDGILGTHVSFAFKNTIRQTKLLPLPAFQINQKRKSYGAEAIAFAEDFPARDRFSLMQSERYQFSRLMDFYMNMQKRYGHKKEITQWML